MEVERLSPQQFKQFRDFIYDLCGIKVDEKKVTMLSNRIRSRLRARTFDNFDNYYRYVSSPSGAEELEGFLDAITTNETSFFRTSKQFDWLEHEFVDQMVELHRSRRRAPTLKLWSAGCANGAEPYSMAISLLENRYRLHQWELRVLGTDLSEGMLAKARQAIYPDRMLKQVSENIRKRYFQEQPDELWKVRPRLTDLVTFEQHNLMRPLRETGFDCIFIRNVLIYFDQASKRVVIKHLLSSLAPGGYLVLGPSEGVYDMLVDLEKISPLIYRKPAVGQSDSQFQRRPQGQKTRKP